MKRKGWVRSEWRLTENRRRARYYELTRAGEAQLVEERAVGKGFQSGQRDPGLG